MTDPCLKVFKDKSVYVDEDGNEETFEEGEQDQETKGLVDNVKDKYENGDFEKIVDDCKSGEVTWNLSSEHEKIIDDVANGVEDNLGRAVAALTILQLTIKSFEPKLNIRLHKGSISS